MLQTSQHYLITKTLIKLFVLLKRCVARVISRLICYKSEHANDLTSDAIYIFICTVLMVCISNSSYTSSQK